MPDSIAERLSKLRSFDRLALCELWKQVFEASPPSQLRRDLMIPMLSYRIQEQAFGSLTPGSLTRLRQLGRAFEADSNSPIASVPGIKHGTRLLRQWRGQAHLVNVEPNGYEYQGARYTSLSEIARLITGTRWSGPLFFGLKKKKSLRTKETK